MESILSKNIEIFCGKFMVHAQVVLIGTTTTLSATQSNGIPKQVDVSSLMMNQECSKITFIFVNLIQLFWRAQVVFVL